MTTPRDLPSETASSAQEVRQLQKYALGDQVAQGGMGAVLRAQDLNIERTVAMKVVLAGMEGSPALIQRFAQEARITGQLEHPSIVPVYSLGTDEQGRTFYTMKFVQGVTLHEVLEKIKAGDADAVAKYPLTHLLTIFQKVCDAVAFAHSKGVVHRDLKPANIMIGDYGEVLVMDWGLAKKIHGANVERPTSNAEHRTSEEHSVLSPQSSSLTLDGQVMGTPQFMAPEQAMGKVDEIDARSDIFSLGAILYNILTLHPPVTGDTVQEILRKIRAGEIAHPSAYNPRSSKSKGKKAKVGGATMPRPPLFPLRHCPGGRIPDSLSAVTMKALALRKEDRYQTVRELQNDIEAYQGGFATAAERAGAVKLIWLLVKRHKVESIASALIVVLVAGFMVKVIASERRARATLSELRGTAPEYYDKALLLIEQRKFDEALQKISYAISLAPEIAEYHYLKGNLLQSSLRLKEAEEEYRRTLDCQQDHQLAAENLKLSENIRRENQGKKLLAAASLHELQMSMVRQGRAVEASVVLQKFGTDKQKLYDTWKSVLEKAGIWSLMQQTGRTLQQDESGMFQLDLNSLPIHDLSPLEGMPLNWLALDNTKVRDLRPLKGMPLTELKFNHTKVSDITPLKGMPLKSLRFDETQVADISVVRDMPLVRLDAAYTGVSDISLLRSKRLLSLDLGNTEVADITVLKGMPLEDLRLRNTKVRDISVLEGMPLTYLDLSDIAVSDISVLKGMPLKILKLPQLNVTDYSVLAGMPLNVLDLSYTAISDLTVLRGIRLTYLNLCGTKVSDLSALPDIPLQELYLWDCKNLNDLTPLVRCKRLETLGIPEQCKDIEFLRELPNLRILSNVNGKLQPAAEFWKEYDAKKKQEDRR